MAPTKKKSSIDTKKEFIAKSRRANYRASLRLEDIQAPSSQKNTKSKEAVIAQYKAAANQAK